MRRLALRVGQSIAIAAALTVSARPTTGAAADARVADAAQRQDRNTLQRLLTQGADVNAPQPDGATALHWAVHWGDVEAVDLLIRAGAIVNRVNDLDVPPLRLACDEANATVVSRLLDAGGSPNAVDRSGTTVLMACARTGSEGAVRSLIAAGAKVDAVNPAHGQTALMWAVAEGHAGVVKALVERGANVNARSASGFTPLMFAARRGDPVSTAALVAAGARVDDAAPDGRSALLIAALSVDAITVQDYRLESTPSGHEAVAVWLVTAGADPKLADDFGMTPLHAAVEMEKPRLITALVTRGADLDARLTRGLPYRRGDVISRAGYSGATPFWLAARKGDVATMRLLAAAGADPNLPSENGTTPLLVAAGLGQTDSRMVPEGRLLEAVKVAMELGCDVRARNRAGRNAVHGAAGISAHAIIRFLAAQGVPLDLADNRGETPLDVTRETLRPRPETGVLLRDLATQPAAPIEPLPPAPRP